MVIGNKYYQLNKKMLFNKLIKKEKEMEISIITVLANFWLKVGTILSTCWGWLSAATMTLFAFLLPVKEMAIILLIIVGIDTILGLWINRKSIQSSKLRNAIIKTIFYMVVLTISFAIEAPLGIFILAKVVFAVCALVEFISVIANMSIICPNMKVFSFVKKILKDEISKKLGIDSTKVDEMLD